VARLRGATRERLGLTPDARRLLLCYAARAWRGNLRSRLWGPGISATHWLCR
jgi:hypothetical protein